MGIVFDTLRSSMAVFPCLPSLETSSPVLESIFLEPLIRPEPRSTPSPMDGPLGAIPQYGFLQILFFVGFLEIGIMKDITGGEFIGDFRNDWIDFGWDTFDEEEQLFKRGVELNNGRAAMLGILGLMVHEQLGGVLPIVGQM